MNAEWIGLIPAAGKGLRLGLPYPKELYPVIRNNRYKPVSQFVVDQMLAAGLQHLVFVVNETKHQLIGYFGSGQKFGCNFSFVVQEAAGAANQSTSPGLAHALDSAYHLTAGRSVLFGMPDTIMQPNDVFLRGLETLQPEADVLLCLFPTAFPHKFGMVRMDADNRVIEIVDKPAKTNLKYMWGCILWKPRFTEYLHKAVNQDNIGDFALIMNRAITDGFCFTGMTVSNGNFIDLGTYEEIMALDQQLRIGGEA